MQDIAPSMGIGPRGLCGSTSRGRVRDLGRDARRPEARVEDFEFAGVSVSRPRESAESRLSGENEHTSGVSRFRLVNFVNGTGRTLCNFIPNQ